MIISCLLLPTKTNPSSTMGLWTCPWTSFLHHLSSLPGRIWWGKGGKQMCHSPSFTLHKTAWNPSWNLIKNDLRCSSAGLWKMRPGSPFASSSPLLQTRISAKLHSHVFSTGRLQKMFSVDKTIYFHYGSRIFLSIIQYNVFIIKIKKKTKPKNSKQNPSRTGNSKHFVLK